ncbi:MAG: type IX secretion system outer membrane channel protein PorV [Verrucomicrobia bacterium]|nr:type IX secretion system outer membrane channel protein PorV [Cytophagales bacterium]
MKLMKLKGLYCLLATFMTAELAVFSQTLVRPITTATPFLTISPDSRSGALGDAGVAISPDANAIYWNAAKMPFIKQSYGASLSYTPWLKTLIGDMSINHLSGFYKLNKTQVIGAYLTYFNLGGISFTSANGSPILDFRPREFSIAAAIGQKLSDNMGISITLRYIHSNLAGSNSFTNVGETSPGNTAAGDIAWYYNKNLKISAKQFNLAFGANISNIGAKITYSSAERREFIPTNLKIGTALTYEADMYNKITFTVDLNKLMVPTPEDTGAGVSTSKPYLSGIFGSFGDAPGGLKEEFQEVIINTGLEYWYNDAFAVRAGYFRESMEKGGRRYLTVGAGFRYKGFGFDGAYLIPAQQNNPLAETLRFTLHFSLEKNTFNDAPLEEDPSGTN